MSDTAMAFIIWAVMAVFLILNVKITKLIIKGKPIPKVAEKILGVKKEKE